MIDKQFVKNLKTYQEEVELKKAEISKKKEAFELELSGLIDEVREKHEKIEALKESLSKQAVEEFQETGNKTLYGGIKVQETKVITYDEAKALDFAKEKDMFLQLDKKAFEKSAESLKLGFVTIDKVPKTTFPKKIKLEE